MNAFDRTRLILGSALLTGIVLIECNLVLGQVGGGSPSIKVNCDDSKSDTDSVEECAEWCASDYAGLKTIAQMRALVQSNFEQSLDDLYSCRGCGVGQHGCAMDIESEPFTEAECDDYDIIYPVECDGDNDNDDYKQVMCCYKGAMDWSYNCAECIDD